MYEIVGSNCSGYLLIQSILQEFCIEVVSHLTRSIRLLGTFGIGGFVTPEVILEWIRTTEEGSSTEALTQVDILAHVIIGKSREQKWNL